MASMPFLCRGDWFSPKLSYHRIVSLALYLPIFYFSFYQKTNLHLYKGARLTLIYTLTDINIRRTLLGTWISIKIWRIHAIFENLRNKSYILNGTIPHTWLNDSISTFIKLNVKKDVDIKMRMYMKSKIKFQSPDKQFMTMGDQP